MQEKHQHYMDQCLQLAAAALAAGDPPVGAIVVLDDQVIGLGQEAGKSTGDITNHAEILAIRDAINNGFTDQLSRAKMYTTHEPCIMCSYLIRHHRIPELVYGTAVPFLGGSTSRFNILSAVDIPKWGSGPNITSGICREACDELSEVFKKRLAKL